VQRTLSLLVLAGGRAGCIGVDLSSGGLVMAQWPSSGSSAVPVPKLDRFVVASGPRSASDVIEAPETSRLDPLRPDAVLVNRPLVPVGRLRRRTAERYLRPLLLPARQHMLGFAGMSVPYWTVAGDRPSLCLVEPVGGMVVTPERTVRFSWRGVRHDLPLGRAPRTTRPLSGTALADSVGFLPRRVLVALSPPRAGLCHKLAPALLP
jgi:hypothetical protein